MKKLLSLIILSMFLYPAVTFAAWWNPLTWKIFARQETAYNLEVQNIEATKRASEEKINELQKQVEELRKQNSSSTATTTSLKIKSIDKNTTVERNLNKDIEQKNRELLIKRNLENQKNLEKAKIVTGSSVVPVSTGSDWYTYQDGSKFNTKTLETILSPEGQKKKWDEENRQADLRQIESNRIIAENVLKQKERDALTAQATQKQADIYYMKIETSDKVPYRFSYFRITATLNKQNIAYQIKDCTYGGDNYNDNLNNYSYIVAGQNNLMKEIKVYYQNYDPVMTAYNSDWQINTTEKNSFYCKLNDGTIISNNGN